MGKRKLRASEGENPRKRQRIVHEAPTSEEIYTARQLGQLLAFNQDLRRARHGLQSFKLLLDELNDPEKESSERLGILTEYLESSKPRDHGDDEAVYLSDIMNIWSFASQINNDGILSAVPVVLELLLKVLSSILDLKSHGLGICRTLLHKGQQELLAKNLSAEKGKEFIISPTLRLLREAMCFDGGVLAKPIFRARNLTYRSLARNMGIKFLGDGIEEVKRPSGRTNAIRFFLSSLKFLHTEAKAELLSQKELVAALIKTIKDDPPHLVLEILDGLKNFVVMDKKLPRTAKSRCFNPNTLSRIAALYSYSHDVAEESSHIPIDEVAHRFLMLVCTSSNAGILREQAGFYPKGVELDEAAIEDWDDSSENVLDRVSWANHFTDEIPVHNTVISELIQGLRPWSSAKQSELVVAIFSAAPELVAWYFLNKRTFTFDPKLSATWIGYAALLFSTVRLDVPAYFGLPLKYGRMPPPTSILVDNIIPPPLTQKDLSRCLSQNSKSSLVSFFAIRLLVIALEKLGTALKLHEEAARTAGPLWGVSARKLVDEFCQRCPNMSDIITAYRAIPSDKFVYKEATSRAIRLYYEVIPQVTLLSKFDVSPFLVGAMKQLKAARDSPQDFMLNVVELENLLAIASYSPGMRWFSRTDNQPLSPFVMLMKICVESPDGLAVNKVRDILGAVAEEHQLVLSSPDSPGLSPLLETLAYLATETSVSLESIWKLLDNCATRCASTPIKYIEMMGDIVGETCISPLILAIIEQLPFATAPADDVVVSSLADFLSIYVGYSEEAGLRSKALEKIIEEAVRAFPEESGAVARLRVWRSLPEKGALQRSITDGTVTFGSVQQNDLKKTEISTDQDDLRAMLHTPLSTYEDNAALVKWASKTVDDLVEEGYAISLIRLLASPHASIRKEALTNISKMAAKIQDSSYEEKEQVWLLLSELRESARTNVDDGPLPSHITSFTCHALDVLKNPLHCLYAKVNTFLTAGPVWSSDKLPLVNDILQEGPMEDNAYYTGISWLLGYLLDSLQTVADLSVFHRKRLFERLFSLAGNVYMRQPLRMQILKIVYRASCIETGSTTLVTRFGVLGWLQGLATRSESKAEAGIYRALLERIWDTCDQDRVTGWSKQGVRELVKSSGAVSDPIRPMTTTVM